MCVGKAPAFQFYASNFLTGTNDMSVEEVGIYIRLLATSWDKGPLPVEPSRLARIAGAEIEQFVRSWQVVRRKWKKTRAGYVNERLEQQREAREAFAAKQAINAKKRWPGITTAVPPHKPRHSHGNALQSLVSDLQSVDQNLPSKEHSGTRERAAAREAEFSAFWTRYPNKAKKQAALAAWLKLAPDAGLIQRIHAALDWQVRQPRWLKDNGEFVPHGSSWLNGKRWEDEPFAAATVESFDEQFERVAAGHGRLL